MRINRFLASAGLGSRRTCEDLVRSGRVLVNNAVVTDLATQVDPADIVRVGRKVVHPLSHVYILLNKPAGYVCTRSDELGRKTIFDLVPSQRGRLFHVGRLDKESSGLIVLTNDGDFAEQLTHPSHQIDKEYEVVIDKAFDAGRIPKLLRGITLESGRARMESVHILAPTRLKITLRQGLKRQIREMLWRSGYDVKKLHRTRIGPLRDPRLKTGYWRFLDRDEIAALRESAEVAPGKVRRAPAKAASPKFRKTAG
ncbi:MAG: pseudouridine synthase [Terrimicrobiaceae bacterium]|nr:pseudouridine synthase [Terrimicrobiaceae bacterium]